MPELGSFDAAASRTARRVERAGVLLLLVAFGFFLWRGHELIPWSDPSGWFNFGRHFFELFGATRLAYGFPLLVHGAVALAGPIWAYLVNLPVLVVLAGLLYAFSRCLVPREPEPQAWLAPVAGAVTLALLVWTGPELLIDLVSPYRDPLSYVLVLLSCLCVLRYRNVPQQPTWIVGAGASLALACSTRETSGLMLLPFLLFGWVSRRALPLRRAVGLFAVSFVLFCIPMFAHNHGVSGRFWVPAQAAASFVEQGSLTPGVRPEHMGRSFPRALGHLWQQLGWPTLLLAAVGVADAARRRQREILFLVVPALAAYLIFYGGYRSLVPRYLFVVYLFVVPTAGVGAALLLRLLLRPLGAGRLGRAAATGVVAGAVAFAIFVPLDASREQAEGFRIADARALTHHFEALVPDDRPILAEKLIGLVLRSFVPNSERVLVLRPRRVFAEPAVREQIREVVRGADEAYFVSVEEPLTQFMRSEFDLELLATFPASAYGLVAPRRGPKNETEARFHVDRVTRWKRLEASRVLGPFAGRRLLEVDVGHLSSEERRYARLYWNEELLDENPRDGENYYVVREDSPRKSLLRLRSDRPVPARIDASLRPLTQPVEMTFDADEEVDHRGRLSASFFGDPGSRYPKLLEEGSVVLPTPEPAGAVFVAIAEVLPMTPPYVGRHELTVATSLGPFYRVRFRGQRGVARKGGIWHRVTFPLHEPLVSEDETRLVWHYQGAERADARPGLALRSLVLYRHQLAPGLKLDVGADGDEPFLLDGFGVPESLPGPARHTLRATAARAELRIPLSPDPRPALLRVHYLTGLRPASAPAAAPEFLWNGVPLLGGSQEEPVGRFTRVTARLPLSSPLLTGVVNQLVIRSTPWQGRGILLERVTLERTPG